jgi:hypothetical protein
MHSTVTTKDINEKFQALKSETATTIKSMQKQQFHLLFCMGAKSGLLLRE